MSRPACLGVWQTWSVLFPFISTCAACAAHLAVVAYSARFAVGNYFLLLVLFGVLTIGPVPVIYWCRQSVCVDMAARTLKWDMCQVSMAVEQQSRATAAARAAAPGHSVRDRDGAESKSPSNEAGAVSVGAQAGDCEPPWDAEHAADEFGDIVLIAKQRQFASFFIDLIASTTDCQFNLITYLATLVTGGVCVVDGTLSLGDFAVLLATASSLQGAAESMASQLVQLPHGYAALRHLGEVFNDDHMSSRYSEAVQTDPVPRAPKPADVDNKDLAQPLLSALSPAQPILPSRTS